MRLATWNSQPGLKSNWDAIEELDADVVAIQEARSDTPELVEQHEDWDCVWRAGTYYPGLAVLARWPFKIERREPSEPFAISTMITGPERFRFVDFWAMTPGNVGRIPYTEQAKKVIEQLPDDVPTVVAGDFNRSKSPYHLKNVRRLNERGLVSAYHKDRRICHTDQEKERTRYAAGLDGPAWHIDFVFVPDENVLDHLRNLILHVRQHVAIRVQRQQDTGVPERLGDDLRVDSGAQESRCICVA